MGEEDCSAAAEVVFSFGSTYSAVRRSPVVEVSVSFLPMFTFVDDDVGDCFKIKASTPNPMINDADAVRKIFQPRVLARLLSLVSIPKLLMTFIRLIFVKRSPFAGDLLCELDENEDIWQR